MIKPILRDFPDAFETERLLIRSPRAGDGPELNAAVLETFENLKPWMPWAQQRPRLEESESLVRQAQANFMQRSDMWLLLFLKGSQTLVGNSGLHPKGWELPKFEIGYWCRKRFEGQGFISEAVRGITAFAFETLGARRVEIRCDSRNDRSRRVAERGGYHLEGELRHDSLSPDGELRNTLLFSITPDEHAALRKRP